MINADKILKSLVLLRHSKTGKILGTGFFVTDKGHFVTAYHVTRNVCVKDYVRCHWQDQSYHVQKVCSLLEADFYQSLGETLRLDITIYQIISSNEHFATDFLPLLNFDISEKFTPLEEVHYIGYRINGRAQLVNDFPICRRLDLTMYNKANSTWEVFTEDILSKGNSGSPIVDHHGHVVGLLVQGNQASDYVAIQSMHMLTDAVRRYDRQLYLSLIQYDTTYQAYRASQQQDFCGKAWPYAIDEDVFVSLFEFKTYSFDNTEAGQSKNTDCIQFLKTQLQDKSCVFCTGFYGMGKSTIARHFFENTKEPCIFLSLSGKHLSRYTGKSFTKEVCQSMLETMNKAPYELPVSRERLEEYVLQYLNSTDIIYVFDGIDEAIHPDNSLHTFIELLENLQNRFLLTSRKEFYAFFNAVHNKVWKKKHAVMELLPWSEKQWSIYTDQLRKIRPDKKSQIDQLLKSLKDKAYEDLPERPLFLKMISDLELGEPMGMHFPPDLRKNRSYIYKRYIYWKIDDDWRRKYCTTIKVDPSTFFEESRWLFRKLANLEYCKSVPEEGAVAFIHSLNKNIQANRTEDLQQTAGFSLAAIEAACSGLSQSTCDIILDYLVNQTTFFSLIYRNDGQHVRFSHKSFCEYLFAHNLAASIFPKAFDREFPDAKPLNIEFTELWKWYQTVEVSTHFKNDVTRIQLENGWTEEQRNGYIQSAFEAVLLKEEDFCTYSELIEELLYYSGHFKLQSSAVISLLKHLIAGDPSVHPVYYRTAHLSLAMMENVDYCLDYVDELINQYGADTCSNAFQVNRDIQENYYGASNLHTRLKSDIDNGFVATEILEGVMPLKIFSYFECQPFKQSEIGQAWGYLKMLQNLCRDKSYLRMCKMLENIRSIMEKNCQESNA